jgi:uncharacterized RDD family membrane protein YckC
MRCPKCHYISFGSADRCRNCGYEFSLAADPPAVDLPIQAEDPPIGPMDDFPLSEHSGDSSMLAPPASERLTAPPSRPAAATSRIDLPLFADRGVPDDAPLITPSAVPRPPLSVRRAAPATAKPRLQPVPPPLVQERSAIPITSDDDDRRNEDVRSIEKEFSSEAELTRTKAPGELLVAPIVRRLLAGLTDIAILGSVDAGVVYLTLRLLELRFQDFRALPPAPLLAFLLLLNGGYLAIFTTAGGQTIGKMLAGIKVVAATEGPGHRTNRVTFGAAVLRAAAYMVSLMAAGLGFLPILFSADRRAFHDRLAETRVVLASRA